MRFVIEVPPGQEKISRPDPLFRRLPIVELTCPAITRSPSVRMIEARVSEDGVVTSFAVV